MEIDQGYGLGNWMEMSRLEAGTGRPNGCYMAIRVRMIRRMAVVRTETKSVPDHGGSSLASLLADIGGLGGGAGGLGGGGGGAGGAGGAGSKELNSGDQRSLVYLSGDALLMAALSRFAGGRDGAAGRGLQ